MGRWACDVCSCRSLFMHRPTFCFRVLFVAAFCLVGRLALGQSVGPPAPLDPQRVQDQDDMTWEDYHPIPGVNWADASHTPVRVIRVALIAADFEDQPFVIT